MERSSIDLPFICRAPVSSRHVKRLHSGSLTHTSLKRIRNDALPPDSSSSGGRFSKFPLCRLRAKFKIANIFFKNLGQPQTLLSFRSIRAAGCEDSGQFDASPVDGMRSQRQQATYFFLSDAEILIGHVMPGTPLQSDDGFRMEASSGAAYLPKDQRQIPPQRPLPPT